MRTLMVGLSGLAMVACGEESQGETAWQQDFAIAQCRMMPTGRNQYFVLEPGYRLVLDSEDTRLQITVLDETKTVDGVVTRVVEEREWKDGELYEVAKNYFAMCDQTKDIYYFGEDVDFYEKGKITKHDGSWLAGNGNRPGLMMAGTPRLSMRYYQEIAPGVAMDRAEVISVTETCKTPAGTFSQCMKVKEGTALNIAETEYKFYAPEVGLVSDGSVRLREHGFVTN
jgi:hypothetical protein